ncbi:MAG: hypothetical protein H0V97_02785 [Actinobacteria bacterium]|nr:hypothetical protein [Actinomycetota bacterium]
MMRSRILAILGCAALVAASAPGAAGQVSGTRSAIEELLERRAAAFMARDQEAFMAPVAGDSAAYAARQESFFEWSAAVPFASYRFEVNWDHFGNLYRPSQRSYGDAGEVVVALVEEHYRISGYDQREAVEDSFVTFIEQDGEWLIAEDSDLDAVGLQSARHLWDFGPIARERSEHFMLLRHPCNADGCIRLPDNFLDLAESALARVNRLWDVPWRQRVVILVPNTTAELGRMLQATFELDNFVAFAYSTYETDEGYDLTGHRIMLNWQQIDGRDDESITTIMAHELQHVATRGVTGPFVPTFVEEGLAEYVGRSEDPDALAFLQSEIDAGSFDGRLPRDFEFVTGEGTDIFRSYQESLSAIRFLAERHGVDDLTRFYLRLGRPEIAPGTSRHHVDRALQATVGSGYDAFQQAWASSIGP